MWGKPGRVRPAQQPPRPPPNEPGTPDPLSALPRPILHTGDVRTVDKLVDGTSNTSDDAHMWLAPVKRQLTSAAAATASAAAAAQRQQSHHQSGGGSLHIDRAALPEAVRQHNLVLIRLQASSSSSSHGSGGSSGRGVLVSGLQVYNYNKSAADAARGVKRMLVLAGGTEPSRAGLVWEGALSGCCCRRCQPA